VPVVPGDVEARVRSVLGDPQVDVHADLLEGINGVVDGADQLVDLVLKPRIGEVLRSPSLLRARHTLSPPPPRHLPRRSGTPPGPCPGARRPASTLSGGHNASASRRRRKSPPSVTPPAASPRTPEPSRGALSAAPA